MTSFASAAVAASPLFVAAPPAVAALPSFDLATLLQGGGNYDTKGAFGAVPLTKQTDPKVGQGLISYYDYTAGSGPSPVYGQVLRLQWAGYVRTAAGAPLVKFDSSVDRGSTLLTKHGSGRLCQGLEEGLHTMKSGGKRRVVMPMRFGYTDIGMYGPLPPGADHRRSLAKLLESADPSTAEVVFDVHLLGVFDDDADPGYYSDASLTPQQLAQVEAQIDAMKKEAKGGK